MSALARIAAAHGRHPAIVLLAALTHPRAPHIDYAAISPFEALLGGSLIVLIVGLLRSRVAREQLVPALTLVTLAATIAVRRSGSRNDQPAIIPARWRSTISRSLDLIFAVAGARDGDPVAGAGRRRGIRRTASTTRCCSPRSPAWRSSSRPRT